MPVPVPVLLPVLPALGIDEPLLEGAGAVDGEVDGAVVVLPLVLVLAPAPALARFARRQSSRCVPVRPTHCEGVVAPAPAVPEVVLLPGAVEVRLSVLDDAPDEPLEPEPEPEPDDCANAADERASSAAAVAAVSVFSIMVLDLLRGGLGTTRGSTQRLCRAQAPQAEYGLLVPGMRIVLFAPLGVGGLLCAVPALRALRAANPDANIALVGLPAARELAARLRRYLDGFVAFPGFPGMPGIECDLDAVPDFFEQMKRQRFDLAMQMHGSGEIANPLMVLMGAGHNAGYYRGGRYCPDAQRYLEWRDDEDDVRRWLRLAAHLGAVPRGSHLELPLEASDWDQWRELHLEHYVCLHCRSQPQRFAEVGDALATEGWNVVLTGSDAVRTAMHQPAVSLAGRTNLGGTAAAIAKASLVVTNDPDALLIAAAMRTPAAVLTGDTRQSLRRARDLLRPA